MCNIAFFTFVTPFITPFLISIGIISAFAYPIFKAVIDKIRTQLIQVKINFI